MPEAARLDDRIGHSPSMACLIGGALFGAAVALLVVATPIGWIGAAIIAGAAVMGAGIGEVASTMSWMPKEDVGKIIADCSPNVFINRRHAARAHLDHVECSKHPKPPQVIATGSGTVFINGVPAARKSDTIECSAVITSGSSNVFIGGGTVPTDPIRPEDLVPGYVHGAMLVVGLASACILAGPVVAIFGLVGGFAGGIGGNWLGGLMFGEGSDGQKVTALVGSFLGGWGAAKAGGRPSTLAQKYLDSKGVDPNVGKFVKGGLPEVQGSATTASEAAGKARENCACAKDPVEVTSGEFMDWRVDLAIPGVLPLTLKRSYASRRELRSPAGLYGPRWLDSWSVSLRRDDAQAHTTTYLDDEGVALVFQTPCDDEHHVLEAWHLRAPHLVLRGTRDEPVLHDRQRGMRLYFEWLTPQHARLKAYGDALGNRIDFDYGPLDARPSRLQALRHSDGWHLQVRWREGVQPCIQSLWMHERDREPVELVRYEHDAQGRLIHSASQYSGRLRYAYDDEHRLVSWGDDSLTQVHISYDLSGRVAEVRTPDGTHSGRFTYRPAARTTQVWEPDPQQTGQWRLSATYQYNEQGLVICETDALGHQTRTRWSIHHRVLSRTDALGRTTRHAYDEVGNLTALIDPRGRRHVMAYDDEGHLLKATDSQGRSTEFTYTVDGLLDSLTPADGLTVHFAYDAQGRLQRKTWGDPASSTAVAHYHYDEAHRPCGHTAPHGARTRWQQDTLGRVDWFTDALGVTTRYEHAPPDEQAPRAQGHVQPVRTLLADGSATSQHHDVEGLLSAFTDASGHTRRWEWGAFDLLKSHTDVLGHTTRYEYDINARLSRLTNPAGQHWQWQRDAAGHVIEETDYAGRRIHWQRDALGRPVLRTAPDGSQRRYEWDVLDDRIHAIEGSDGLRITYAWDTHDQLTVARVWQRRAECSELESESSFDYDAQGRVVQEAHRMHTGPLRKLVYRYDTQGRLISREGPLGPSRYTHHALGWLSELHTDQGSVQIERNALGQETQRVGWGPGADRPVAAHFRLEQRHDKLGRLVQQRVLGGADQLKRHYHWQHEHLQGIDDSRFGSVRWDLDPRGQILKAHYSELQASASELMHQPALSLHPLSTLQDRPRDEQFRYDAQGNVSDRGTHHQLTPLTYHLDTVTEHGGNRYTWDANGRLQTRTLYRRGFRPSTWRYAWDSFDRLRSVTTPEGQRWHYVYDAFGRRRAKRCETPVTPGRRRQLQQAEYLWQGPTLAVQWKRYADGSSSSPAAQGEHHEDIQEWHFEPGNFKPLALRQLRHADAQPQLLHVVSELNGAPREVMDNAGTLLWCAQLDTWGQLARCHVKDRDIAYASRFAPGYRSAANDPLVDIDLRFANQWHDEESGLHYNLHRYYDPSLAGYLSQDPLGPIQGGERTHGYVSNPLTWIDPLGLNECPTLSDNFVNTKLKKHAQDIYTTSRELGTPVAKGDKDSMKNFVLSITSDSGNLANKTPFKWNTIEEANFYVKGNAVVVVNKSTNEVISFLDKRRISPYIAERIN